MPPAQTWCNLQQWVQQTLIGNHTLELKPTSYCAILLSEKNAYYVKKNVT